MKWVGYRSKVLKTGGLSWQWKVISRPWLADELSSFDWRSSQTNVGMVWSLRSLDTDNYQDSKMFKCSVMKPLTTRCPNK